MYLDFLVVGNSSKHVNGPEAIHGPTEFIYNIIHRMGLYEYLKREQKTTMKGYYQDVGHIHTGEMWGMKEEDLHLKLKPFQTTQSISSLATHFYPPDRREGG